MAPEDDNLPHDDDRVAWFHFAYRMMEPEERALLAAMASEEGDSDSARESTITATDNVPKEVACLIRHHADEDTEDASSASSSVLARTITVPDFGEVSKSYLISMLNSHESLSKDRLRRVQTATKTTDEPAVDVRSQIGLYSDIALLIKGPAPSFRLARIIRMRKPGNKQGMVEYIRPIPLNENDKFGSVQLRVAPYDPEGEHFMYKPQNAMDFTVWNVLMGVSLTYSQDNESYHLDASDRAEVQVLLDAEITRQQRIAGQPRRHREENMTDDGRRVTEVTPQLIGDGLNTTRRSIRKRKTISYE
jgi:hypothetical protein